MEALAKSARRVKERWEKLPSSVKIHDNGDGAFADGSAKCSASSTILSFAAVDGMIRIDSAFFPLSYAGRKMKVFFIMGFLLLSLSACSTGQDESTKSASAIDKTLIEEKAHAFAQHLTDGDYETAYAMTAPRYRSSHSVETLRRDFMDTFPADWRNLTVYEEVFLTEPQNAGDAWHAYVTIDADIPDEEGDIYNDHEAVALSFNKENGELVITEVDFGRAD